MISFILWVYLFISLNPKITNKIYNIPVKVVNSSSLKKNGLVLLPSQKFSVNLTVEGRASDIYNLNAENFEIFLDLSLHEFRKGENVVRTYTRSIPSNISIIKPNELDVKILVDEFVEKRVYVDKAIEKSNEEGFYSFNPIITPEYVIVSGASEFVYSVDKAVVTSNFENLKQDTYQSLKVKFLDKEGNNINESLDVYPDIVEMYIMVRATKDVEVDVSFENNLKEGLKLDSIEVIPKQITIIGTEDTISNINKISTEKLDLSDIEENSILEIPLKIPNGIEIIDSRKSIMLKLKISKIN